MLIEMKGMYRIWNATKDNTHEYREESKVNIDVNHGVQTITEFDQVDTRRN
jgi:hypothetical protein